jgi:hypothetical protein
MSKDKALGTPDIDFVIKFSSINFSMEDIECRLLAEEELNAISREDFTKNSFVPPKDLGRLYTKCYLLWKGHGFCSICISELCNISGLIFTVALSLLLFIFFDFNSLAQCTTQMADNSSSSSSSRTTTSSSSNTNCHDNIWDYAYNPFNQEERHWNGWVMFLRMELITLLAVYTSFRLVCSIKTIADAYNTSVFVTDVLKVYAIEEMDWNDVLELLIVTHNSTYYRLDALQENISEFDIISRILRTDAFMIAIAEAEPKMGLLLDAPQFVKSVVGNDFRLNLTYLHEWVIRFCVFEFVWDDRMQLSKAFRRDRDSLKWRFRLIGLLILLALPVLLWWPLAEFFFKNIGNFYSNKNVTGPRLWTPLALWRFKLYQELPHRFERRIANSYELANQYILLFQKPQLTSLAQLCACISGAMVVIFLALSLWPGEAVLLNVRMWDHPLIWWLGVSTAVLAGSRALMPSHTSRLAEHSKILEELNDCTHGCPLSWLAEPRSKQTCKALGSMFQYQTSLLFMDILSTLLLPLVLCCTDHDKLVQFIISVTISHKTLGAVCCYSVFDSEASKNPGIGNGKVNQSIRDFTESYPSCDLVWQSAPVFESK